jgi:hypothetical protein
VRTSPRPPRPAAARSVRSALAALATLLLAWATAYLTLERNHAEEVGGGVRAAAEVLRGGHPVAPLTWAVWAVLAAVVAGGAVTGRVRDRRSAGQPLPFPAPAGGC